MDGLTRCFIIEDGKYIQITLKELKQRSEMEHNFRDRLFIPLHGTLMEVTEKDYKSFYKNDRRQKYLNEEAARNGMFSYNSLDTNDMSGEEVICDSSVDIEKSVIDKLMYDKLHQCLSKLENEEISLIQALYFEGKSEREWSKETGMARKTINDRRHKILNKLKKILKN